MKLELKHIAPYLPYELNVIDLEEYKYSIVKLCLTEEQYVCVEDEYGYEEVYVFDYIKPILRPLSSITKKEAYELGVLLMGEADMEDKNIGTGKMVLTGTAYPSIMYQDKEDDEYSVLIQFGKAGISGMSLIPYEAYEWLFKKHFDVFGLIDKGLAVEKKVEL